MTRIKLSMWPLADLSFTNEMPPRAALLSLHKARAVAAAVAELPCRTKSVHFNGSYLKLETPGFHNPSAQTKSSGALPAPQRCAAAPGIILPPLR